MERIIVHFENDISAFDAFYYVGKVIAKGRISQSVYGPSFSDATVWESGMIVTARRNKNSDTFHVGRNL